MGRFIDLTGKKFGRLKVLERAKDHVQPSGCKKVQWKCRCDCDKEVIVQGGSLRNGVTKSCGCLQKELVSKRKIKDLVGQKFGRLIVIEKGPYYVGPKGTKRLRWRCRCECGEEALATSFDLTRGRVQSCGCLRREIKFIDLTGNDYFWLTVITLDEERTYKTNRTYWLCYCNPELGGCGNITSVRADSLKGGEIKSCGCYSTEVKKKLGQNKFKDKVGRRFGKGVVLRRNLELSDNKGKVVWDLKCDCKNNYSASTGHLVSGDVRSCGCLRDEKIRQVGLRQTGTKSPAWKPDKDCVTSLHCRIRTSSQYSQWREQVFERDDYTCQVSGQRGVELVVHHIKPFTTILEENSIETFEQALECKELWNVGNGITLSKEWHSQTSDNELAFHRVYGVRNFIKEDFKCWEVKCGLRP